jgi:cytosine permease
MSEKKKHVSEDFEQTSVSQESRRGFMSMLVVMLGFTFFSASMWAGGTLGAGMDFEGLVGAVMAGNLILGAYCGALAFIAARTGNSIHILCRYSFGVKGSYLPSFLLGITQVGWFGVGVAMFSIPVQKWLISLGYEGAANSSTLWIITIIAGCAMTSTAYFGIKSLTILSYVAVPAIIILGMYSSIRALTTGFPVAEGSDIVRCGWDIMFNHQPAEGAAISAATAIAISVGSFISGGSCTPDFVRFSKNAKIAVITTVIAFFLGNSLMFFFGAVGTMTYQVNDISEVLFNQGLIVWAILALGLNIWTTNDNAIYTSGLGFSNITGIPKRYTVLFNGILGTLTALWLYNHFVSYLNILNIFIPPVGAVVIADYFLRRDMNYLSPDKENFRQIFWPGVLAWGVGVYVAICMKNFGIPAINGMMAAALVYVLLCNGREVLQNVKEATKEEEKKD